MSDSSGDNQLLMTIHQSIMQLVAQVSALQSGMDHMAGNQAQQREDFNFFKKDTSAEFDKTNSRVKELESALTAHKAFWKGPKVLVASAVLLLSLLMSLMSLSKEFIT